jgi:protein prenyltransferase alpha subunit repeat containing protein 1
MHVSDYTAAHHLCNLVRRFSLSDSTEMGFGPLLNHALDLVAAYPDHEALWLYLRLVMRSLDLEERTGAAKLLDSLSETDGQYAVQCRKWLNR